MLLDARTEASGAVDDANRLRELRRRPDLDARWPDGRGTAATVGVDFDDRAESFLGARDLTASAGVSGSSIDVEGGGVEQGTAVSGNVSTPNDEVQLAARLTRIDEDFAPELGSVRRTGIHLQRADLARRRWIDRALVRRLACEAAPEVNTALDHGLQTGGPTVQPLGIQVGSNDELSRALARNEDRLDADFEIADGVTIPPGACEFLRGGVALESSDERRLGGRADFTAGGDFDGTRDDLELGLGPRATRSWSGFRARRRAPDRRRLRRARGAARADAGGQPRPVVDARPAVRRRQRRPGPRAPPGVDPAARQLGLPGARPGLAAGSGRLHAALDPGRVPAWLHAALQSPSVPDPGRGGRLGHRRPASASDSPRDAHCEPPRPRPPRMQPPSSNTKRSLQLAKQLADFIPGCNPLDTNDLSQILREVGALRGNLRADAAEVEDYLCSLAERMVELIERHGHIAGRQAFSIVVDILEQVATSMSAELQSAAAEATTRAEVEPSRRLSTQTSEAQESAVDLSSSGVGLRLMDQRKLGEILVSLSMLTPAQVESALRHQKSSGMRFGESLVELGLIKKNALEATLRIQRRQSSSRSSPPPWAS